MVAVCVFCSSSTTIDPRHLQLASDVGTELARRGHELVSGGGSVGSMGAVARAARAGGARTVGVIPQVLAALEVADHDADELVVTVTMRERKAMMDARTDAFLVLPGGIGTLEELLEIWVARTLAMHDRPVVVLDPLGVFAPLARLIDDLVDSGFVRPGAREQLGWTADLADAFTLLERHPPQPAPRPAEVLEAER